MLNIVSPGASFTIDHIFYNADGTAFVPASPILFNIRDFNNNLVLNGTAAQDIVVPARWYATVTMPSNVPVGQPDQKYSLNWSGTNALQTTTATELFQVMPTQDYTFIENDKTALEMQSIGDSLVLPSNLTVTTMSVAIVDQNSNSVYNATIDPATGTPFYDKTIYNLSTGALPTMLADNVGMRPYVVQWTYSVGGVQQPPEFHFIYIINTRMLLAMNDLRRMLNKARNEDININLQYSDIDLVHYIQEGMQSINSSAPQVTTWNIKTIPPQFQILLTYASAQQALNAQLLAEGQSAFDFAGQSVSLTVDRTASIESALSNINSYLDANLVRAKKIYARSGGGTGISAGVLGLSIGPSTNRIRNAQVMLDRIRMLGASQGNFW